MSTTSDTRTLQTEFLDIAYVDEGPETGPPVVLMHGFPYDIRAYDAVAAQLAAAGCRATRPYLRGYGPTRFRGPEIVRSGEQAALARDLLDLIDGLRLHRPIVVGYDWGGRAACVVSALWPERVGGLVTGGGYNMFATPDPDALLSPQWEHILWYQRLLNRPDAHRYMQAHGEQFCRYLWSIWSPAWRFDDATFAATAASFANPDFIDVVIHSYRHRGGAAEGDPALADIARRAEQQPPISVPTIILHGDTSIFPVNASKREGQFTGPCEQRILPGIGHNIPQEAPAETVAAILDLVKG